eukprot:1381855-Amphidinium_carterae.1
MFLRVTLGKFSGRNSKPSTDFTMLGSIGSFGLGWKEAIVPAVNIARQHISVVSSLCGHNQKSTQTAPKVLSSCTCDGSIPRCAKLLTSCLEKASCFICVLEAQPCWGQAGNLSIDSLSQTTQRRACGQFSCPVHAHRLTNSALRGQRGIVCAEHSWTPLPSGEITSTRF